MVLWADVQLIADRVHATKGEERACAWHHLLLAVANFKTQATLFPPALPDGSASPHRQDALRVPLASGALKLRAEDPPTWPALSGMTGLREPRATTLLSALWPGRHVVMDWRAPSAAVALAGARLGWDQSLAGPDSTERAERSWESYTWYRAPSSKPRSRRSRIPSRWTGPYTRLGAGRPASPGQRMRRRPRAVTVRFV
jgi:hypothetical protein